MKLRTSLAAAATATAVMVSGAAAADAAPTVNDTAESKSTESEKTTKDGLSSSAGEEGSSIEDLSPEEIKSWIAVITTVVGLLTQILSVASKFSR
ncbi:hypothetical protein [Corynebacterium fournieri]|uniref:hypothetical protein n=1 Tax=Corynebacterium fournieri TaxID=1852390 RepID=UPI000A2EEB72|nr:hypothetical protein [Corynebacterium fournieri]WJY97689.1 hypothetical protein CFOUR_06365 [Corynebacterium fournieri]